VWRVVGGSERVSVGVVGRWCRVGSSSVCGGVGGWLVVGSVE